MSTSDIDDNAVKYDHNVEDIISTSRAIRPSLWRRLTLFLKRTPLPMKLLTATIFFGFALLLANFFNVFQDYSSYLVFNEHQQIYHDSSRPQGSIDMPEPPSEAHVDIDIAKKTTPSAVNICVVTDHYFGSKYQYKSKQDQSCPIDFDCLIIDSPKRTCKKSADALWFHIPHASKSDIMNYKKIDSKKVFVGMSMESAGYYEDMKDPEYMSFFNITMTYRLDSDIVTHYFSDREAFYKMPNATEHHLNEVAYINSNCFTPNHRNTFMKELMKVYPVKSYGKCLNNQSNNSKSSEPENLLEAPQIDKMATMRQHKFCIAIENTNERDYVSEKLWQTLESGCLPIIAGPSNVVEDFLPHPKSALVIDIETTVVEDLADLLKRLAQDPVEYNKFMEWRTMPKEKLSKGFQRLVALQRLPSTQCQLCQKVFELRQRQLKLK